MGCTVKHHMNTTQDTIVRGRVSTSALSIALIAFSALWHLSACIYFATSGFRTDWSATPLLWMLTVTLTPAICFAGGMILVDARKHRQLGMIEWWALAAALLPVTLGSLLSIWAVKVLFTMSGV